MIKTIILVFIGGGIGSVLRYGIQQLPVPGQFPLATLLVNITGCFLAGLLFSLVMKNNSSEQIKSMLIAGFCGGFTTFSAFSLESVQLYRKNIEYFLLYTALSLFVCLAATVLGMRLIK